MLLGYMICIGVSLAADFAVSTIKWYAAIIVCPALGFSCLQDAQKALRFFYQGHYHAAVVRGSYSVIRSSDAQINITTNMILKSNAKGVKALLSATTTSQEPAYFLRDMAEYARKVIEKEGVKKLASFITDAKSNRYKGKKINITGCADITGNADYNLQISIKRAKTAYDFFLAEGVPLNVLSYEGKGGIVDDKDCVTTKPSVELVTDTAIGEPTIRSKGIGIY